MRVVSGDALRAALLTCCVAASLLPARPASAAHCGPGAGHIENLDTSESFCELQAAIDDPDTLDGHTLELSAGQYPVTSTVTVAKGLSIRGPQADVDPRPSFGSVRVPGDTSTETVLDGGGTVGSIVRIAADGVELNGVQVTGGTGDLIRSNETDAVTGAVLRHLIVNGSGGDDGIQLRNCDGCVVEHSHVFDVPTDAVNMCCGSAGSVIRDNEVHEAFSSHGAIYVYDVTGQTIDGNLVYGPRGNAGITVGIASTGSHDVTITGNEVSGREGVAGILVRAGSDDVDVLGNTIFGNGNTADATVTAGVLIQTSVIADVHVNGNDIAGNEAGVLYSVPTPPELDATGNWWGDASGPFHPTANPSGTGDLVGDNVDFGGASAAAFNPPPVDPLGSGAPDVHVSTLGSDANACTTPASPCLTLHRALEKVGPGGTVHMAAGLYPFDRVAHVAKDGVAILGAQAGVDPRPAAGSARTPGGASETILDGGGAVRLLAIAADGVTVDGPEVRTSPGNLVSAGAVTGATVRNSILHHDGGAPNAGVAVSLTNCDGCTVEHNYGYSLNRAGIALVGGSDVAVELNELAGYPYHYGLIWLRSVDGGSVLGNRVSGATDPDGTGILVECRTSFACTGSISLTANRVTGNTGAAGIKVCAQGAASLELRANKVTGNGATGDAPVTAGIEINDHFGSSTCDDANVDAHENRLEGNEFGLRYAVSAGLAGADLDATQNWWGDPSGPMHASNPSGAGDEVSDHVDFDPWLPEAVANGIVRLLDAADNMCGGPNLFFAIQDAIDCAAAGATVLVEPGEYTGGLTIGPGKDGLTLCQADGAFAGCGSDPADAVIDGDASTYAVFIGDRQNPTAGPPVTDVTVQGLTIRNPGYTRTGFVDPSLISSYGDRVTLRNLILTDAAAPLGPGGSRWYTIGINIGAGSDDVAVRDVTIGNIPAGVGTQAVCANEPCAAMGIFNWGGGSGFTIDGAEIVMEAACDDVCAPVHGIATTSPGTTVFGGSVATGSDGRIGGGTAGIAGTVSSVDGTDLAGWTTAIDPSDAAALTVAGGTFEANGTGVVVRGPGSRLVGNSFRNQGRAILIAGSPSDVILRTNEIRLTNPVALELGEDTTGIVVDARLNDWGVYEHRTLAARVLERGTGNRVDQIPFLTQSGPVPAGI